MTGKNKEKCQWLKWKSLWKQQTKKNIGNEKITKEKYEQVDQNCRNDVSKVKNEFKNIFLGISIRKKRRIYSNSKERKKQ